MNKNYIRVWGFYNTQGIGVELSRNELQNITWMGLEKLSVTKTCQLAKSYLGGVVFKTLSHVFVMLMKNFSNTLHLIFYDPSKPYHSHQNQRHVHFKECTYYSHGQLVLFLFFYISWRQLMVSHNYSPILSPNRLMKKFTLPVAIWIIS